MRIVPVNFKSEHKAMLGHCKMILEDDGGSIGINPDRFDKLITALRAAVDNEGMLDKEATSYVDIFDAFRLAMKFYRFENSGQQQGQGHSFFFYQKSVQHKPSSSSSSSQTNW